MEPMDYGEFVHHVFLRVKKIPRVILIGSWYASQFHTWWFKPPVWGVTYELNNGESLIQAVLKKSEEVQPWKLRGGGFNYFLFSPHFFEEMIQFDEHIIFFMWVETNHQVE